MASQSIRNFAEPAKLLPEMPEFDVIVCGGGPAGIAAAIASARSGARTLLLEVGGCLGGVWTAGSLTWIIDSGQKSGLMKELLETLQNRSPHISRTGAGTGLPFDVEAMKIVLDEWILASGVEVQLHTRIVAAHAENGRLTHVLTESKSGRQAWRAGCFVDCTGDGDLAALAGCGFDIGKPVSGECQPMSLIGMVTGVDPNEVGPFLGGGLAGPKSRLFREFERAGVQPSYSSPILLHLFDSVFTFIVNHEYGVSALSSADVTKATMRARSEIHKLVDALRELRGPWAGIRVLKTAEHIGVREARRIRGRYRVTEDDLEAGRSHEDGICCVRFGVDVHNTNPSEGRAMEKVVTKSLPYEIPLRALIARDVKGLLMAGRCISGDFIAHSSYRVTGNAVPMGEAAGVLAAIASQTNRPPETVPYQEVLDHLDLPMKTPELVCG